MAWLGNLLPGVEHLHNLHPLTVHFPIAFLMGAGLLYGMSWIWPNDKREWAAYWFLLLGFWACIVAVATGFYAYYGVNVSNSVQYRLATPHMIWMVSTFLITVALTSWAIVDKPFPRAGRRVFLLLFVILLLTMTRGADYGSRLVFDYNADGDALSHPIRYSR
jgi:uncharacterized membrane protein